MPPSSPVGVLAIGGQRATRVFEQAFPYRTTEPGPRPGDGPDPQRDPAVRAAVGDLVTRLRALPTVADIHSPLAAEGEGLRFTDWRSVLVGFQLAGDFSRMQRNVAGPLAAVAAVGEHFPRLHRR